MREERQRLRQDRFQLGRGAQRKGAQRWGLHGEPLARRGRRCGSRERKPARHHLVHGECQGVDIRAGVGGEPLDYLRREIRDRTKNRTGSLRGKRAGDGVCHAEVGYLGHPVLIDQDVLGLYIAVDDALLVRVLERARDLAPVADGFGLAKAPLRLDKLAHGEAVHVLHDKEVVAFMLPGIVNRDDVGMLEPGDHAGLTLDAVDQLACRRPGHRIAQDLYRDPAR